MLIQYQILQTKIIRIVWETERKIEKKNREKSADSRNKQCKHYWWVPCLIISAWNLVAPYERNWRVLRIRRAPDADASQPQVSSSYPHEFIPAARDVTEHVSNDICLLSRIRESYSRNLTRSYRSFLFVFLHRTSSIFHTYLIYRSFSYFRSQVWLKFFR